MYSKILKNDKKICRKCYKDETRAYRASSWPTTGRGVKRADRVPRSNRWSTTTVYRRPQQVKTSIDANKRETWRKKKSKEEERREEGEDDIHSVLSPEQNGQDTSGRPGEQRHETDFWPAVGVSE